MSAAQGRQDHGPPIGVIDIGSNSVRLVVYEGLTRSPTPDLQRKGPRRARPRGAVDRAAGRRRSGEGACSAQTVPRAVRPHAGRTTAGARHRGVPRRHERQGFHRRGRAHLPHQDRGDLRQARGRAFRARRGLGIPSARRHRRRPRRRLARTHRPARAQGPARASRCRSAASRSPTFPRARSRRPRRS